MTILRLLGLVLILGPLVLVIDLLWLGLVMRGFYAHEMGELMRRQGSQLAPRWGAASLVYVLIPAGLVLFVRPRLGADATTGTALAWGALFGLVLYGVYDMTNLAVLEKWTTRLAIVDIAWGCVLCGITSVLMRWIALGMRL